MAILIAINLYQKSSERNNSRTIHPISTGSAQNLKEKERKKLFFYFSLVSSRWGAANCLGGGGHFESDGQCRDY
jgi:hypothetical protein